MDAASSAGAGAPPVAPDAPLTQAKFFERLANEAWQAGQAAMQEGNPARAGFWLERAARLAPQDPAIALTLAAVHLRRGFAPAALAALDRLPPTVQAAEAAVLLATARHLAGDPRAAETLAMALAQNAVPATEQVRQLGKDLALLAGAPGWCCVTPEGDVVAEAVMPGRLEVAADKRRLARQPRRVPEGASVLSVTVGGRHCLGSPVDLQRLCRLDGIVSARDGGLAGWAWHPFNPDRDPALRVVGADGRGVVHVTAADQNIAAQRPLARPRGFAVPASQLAGLRRPVRVIGPDGRDIAGSPIDPGAETAAAVAAAQAVARRYPLRGKPAPGDDPLCHAAAAAFLRGPPAAAPLVPTRPVVVVVPVHRGLAVTRACLDSVLATAPAGTQLVVVDDASPEAELSAHLDDLAARGAIRLLRHATNRGFPASANAGMRAAAALPGAPDIVLLNSDAVATSGWIEGLRAAVHAAPDLGTATPLSNDATILSYPDAAGGNAPPEGAALDRLARLAARANAGVAVEVPTAVGFCMYIRRECLAATGLFREDVFAQGYGEENDFCLRATRLGWRHAGVPGVFVAHVGGQSFGTAAAPLVARNLEVLERLHPGYRAGIAAFTAADPLAPARRRLDLERWQAARPRAGKRQAGGAVVLVTHDSGGGVERLVRQRATTLRNEGRRAVILRPVPDRMRAGSDGAPAYHPGLCRVEDGGEAYPNLVFSLPREIDALARLLRGDRPTSLEIHHLLGHDHAVMRLAAALGVPLDVHIHDYAWLCPRVTLVGPERRYCGEPEDTRVCDACVADAGRAMEEEIGVAALRARSARDLAGARRVVTPSGDAAARMRRHFPGLVPEVEVHENDAAALAEGAAHSHRRPAKGRRRRVCIVGGIGPEKGYDVVLACARDAVLRNLPLEFVLVGHTPDDRRLLDTGRVAVTGTYREGEGETLVREQQADIAWLPSLWPETWCFTLGVAWRAGLKAAVFDIGAQAERVKATGQGWVLPLGLPVQAINNTLLAVEP